VIGQDNLSGLTESDRPRSGTKRSDRPIVASGAAGSSIHEVSASTKADPMRPHELRDDQWDLIRSGLPGRAGSVGVTAANNRRFVEAVSRPERGNAKLAMPESHYPSADGALPLKPQAKKAAHKGRVVAMAGVMGLLPGRWFRYPQAG
jgi:hypothetical protein